MISGDRPLEDSRPQQDETVSATWIGGGCCWAVSFVLTLLAYQ